jgi:Ni,Fe-hydrogenase I large subunit
MSVTFNIDPVSRIEGHLKLEITVDTALDPNPGTVSLARCESKLFRGLENILKRRDPRDAPVIAQRI